MFTAIMSLIALSFTYAAREQVETAQMYKDKLLAEIKLKEAKSILLSTLFSKDSHQLTEASVEGVRWNFRNQPFVVADVKVRIQSTAGLFSLISTTDEYWVRLLSQLGVSSTEQTQMMAALRDWQDKDANRRYQGAEDTDYAATDVKRPRDGTIQSISELKAVKGISSSLFEQLKPLVTPYMTSAFNPALAPERLIRAVFADELAEQILQLQQQGKLTQQAWWDLTKMTNYEGILIHPFNQFHIELQASVGNAKALERFDLEIQSQDPKKPLLILKKY